MSLDVKKYVLLYSNLRSRFCAFFLINVTVILPNEVGEVQNVKAIVPNLPSLYRESGMEASSARREGNV